MASIKLGLGRQGWNSTIEVDGHDISAAARAFRLDADVHGIPQLVVDLVVLESSTVSGEATVVIPEATREALIALGWTPPEG